jgi:hypothetical protein
MLHSTQQASFYSLRQETRRTKGTRDLQFRTNPARCGAGIDSGVLREDSQARIVAPWSQFWTGR